MNIPSTLSNDLSPETIASIARRLYNEIPGMNSVPRSDGDALHALGEVPTTAEAPLALSSAAAQLPVTVPAPGSAERFAGIPSHTGIPSYGGSSNHTSLPNYPGIASQAGLPAHAGALPHSGIPADDDLRSHTGAAGIPSSAPGYSNDVATGLPFTSQDFASGLRNFVRGIHGANVRDDAGQCALHPASDALNRIFAKFKGALRNESSRPLDVATIRRDFPALNQLVHGKPLAWLDNGATTQKPQSVIDALANFYAHDNSNIHRAAHTLAARATDAFEQGRQKVQTFLGASSSKEIIFVRGTTEGINLVAQTYGKKFFRPGDEIVLTMLEHHANIVPWQMVAKETGAVIRVVPVTDRGEIMMEEYQALLGPRTRFVSLAHASNSVGTILPVAEMTQLAKRYNARVLIDGAQSVSHLPVNVQEIDCDFYVFSGHKIFGPTGIGAVYAKQEVMEIMPPYQGGGNMIRTVTFEETTYAEPPARFEAGTPNIADVVGLGAALDYVNRLGRPNIAKYEHELLNYATQHLTQIKGLRLIGTAREKVGVLSFVLKDRKTVEVGKMLDLEGIAVRAGHHCAQPSLRRFGVEATVRPSLAFYNTHEEIDRLVDAVKRILRS
jgi:cysteine desulfurase/selenocysteine lyase